MANDLTGKDETESRPTQWDKRVAAAYLRVLGATQIDAASGVGVCEKTIHNWEHHESWPEAREEARCRWLVDVVDAARMRLLKALKDLTDGALALKVLERMDPELAPAKQHHELSGNVGTGVLAVPGDMSKEDWAKIAGAAQGELAEQSAALVNRIAETASGNGGDGQGG